ncbi:cytochrome P450 4d1-like [Lycorma delicatula]|uniref:cytochrome P450 4d1-like n=1 Tax=Lycorma delicatula TaxID=130591 RepID=UPI003F517066
MDPKLSMAWMANVREDLDVTCYKIFLAIMALLATSLVWHYWKIIRIERTIKKIPGPPIWPITGNAHSFFGLDEHELIQKSMQIIEEYGGSCRVWFGPHLMVFLADPRYIETMSCLLSIDGNDSLIEKRFIPPTDLSKGQYELGLKYLMLANMIPNVEENKNNKLFLFSLLEMPYKSDDDFDDLKNT